MLSSIEFHSIPSHASVTLAIMGPGSENEPGSAEDFSHVAFLAAHQSHNRYSTVVKWEIRCPLLH